MNTFAWATNIQMYNFPSYYTESLCFVFLFVSFDFCFVFFFLSYIHLVHIYVLVRCICLILLVCVLSRFSTIILVEDMTHSVAKLAHYQSQNGKKCGHSEHL